MSVFLLVIVDALCTAAMIQSVGWLYFESLFPDAPYGFEGATVQSLSFLILAVFSNYAVSLYDRDVLVARNGLFARVAVAAIGASVGSLMIQYFVWYMPNGRITIVSEAVVFAVVSLAWRWVLSSIFRRAPKQAVAVYGTEAVCAEIDQILRAEAYCPFEVRYVVGGTFMEPSPSPETSLKLSARIERVAALETLGSSERIQPQLLVVGRKGALGAPALSAITQLQHRGVRVCSAASLVSDLAGFIAIDLASVDWVVGALDRVQGHGALPLKRLIDVAVSLVGLVIFAMLSPLLFVLAKLKSPGPMFFSQPRVGLGGEVFNIYKLRTMTVVANTEGRWASEEESRISAGGRWLRQLRLDELPQFWNVLRGEMSVVGPRPEQPSITEMLESSIEYLHYRNMIKPGITGWAQVKQGYVDTADASMKKLMYDLYYVQNFGIMLDLEIMVKTAFIMIARIGAR